MEHLHYRLLGPRLAMESLIPFEIVHRKNSRAEDDVKTRNKSSKWPQRVSLCEVISTLIKITKQKIKVRKEKEKGK